jgi:SAM-dependent methyltransferase
MPDLLHSSPGIWQLRQCAECGLVFTSPRIPEEELHKYYPADYAPFADIEQRSHSVLFRFLRSAAHFPYTLRFGKPGGITPPFGGGVLLEVGCGAGGYLQQMSAMGWKCTGLDVSPNAIERGRQLCPNANFVLGTLQAIPKHSAFDLIVMHHVLEHVPNPLQTAYQCFYLLRPGGRMLVSIPNVHSFESRLFGRRWIGLDIPRHIVHFDESNVSTLLKNAGFSIESVRTGFFPSSIFESVLLCLSPQLRQALARTRLERVLYWLFVPLASLSYLFGNRGTLEITASRSS